MSLHDVQYLTVMYELKLYLRLKQYCIPSQAWRCKDIGWVQFVVCKAYLPEVLENISQ